MRLLSVIRPRQHRLEQSPQVREPKQIRSTVCQWVIRQEWVRLRTLKVTGQHTLPLVSRQVKMSVVTVILQSVQRQVKIWTQAKPVVPILILRLVLKPVPISQAIIIFLLVVKAIRVTMVHYKIPLHQVIKPMLWMAQLCWVTRQKQKMGLEDLLVIMPLLLVPMPRSMDKGVLLQGVMHVQEHRMSLQVFRALQIVILLEAVI